MLIVFRLGQQVRDSTTAMVSALFFTFAFMHVRGSHFGTTDVVMTGLIVAAVALILEAHRTRSRRLFLGAGLVAGLAAATKYNAVLLAVPMIVSHLLHVWESPDQRGEAWLDAGILYFSLPFALAFAIGVPFVVLDRGPFLAAMHELAHALRVGDVRMDLGNGWLYHLTFSLRYGMGIPLLVDGAGGRGGSSVAGAAHGRAVAVVPAGVLHRRRQHPAAVRALCDANCPVFVRDGRLPGVRRSQLDRVQGRRARRSAAGAERCGGWRARAGPGVVVGDLACGHSIAS